MEVVETKDSNTSTMMLHKEQQPLNTPLQSKEDLEKELEAIQEEIRTIEALLAGTLHHV